MADLYNQETNLAAMGRFAPGVNYRADIRKPSQPVPSLPEVNSSFNLDLSSIANAYADVKKTELSLAQSEREMGQRMQIAEMEDTRARDIANLNYGTQLHIAHDQNALGWAKLEAEKDKKDKDYSQTLANNYFYDAMRDKAEELRNDPSNRTAFDIKYKQTMDEIAKYWPTADRSKVAASFNTFYPGLTTLQTDIKVSEQKDVNKMSVQKTMEVADNLSILDGLPYQEKFDQASNILENISVMAKARAIANDPNASPEQIAWAQKQIDERGASMAEVSIYTYITNSIPLFADPNANVYELKEQLRVAWLDQSKDIVGDPAKAQQIFDSYWTLNNMDKYLKQAADTSQGNLAFYKNINDTKVELERRKMYTDFPMTAALAAMPDYMRQAMLSKDNLTKTQKSMLQAIGIWLFGNVEESVSNDRFGYYVEGQKQYEATDKQIDQFIESRGLQGLDREGVVTLMAITKNMNQNPQQFTDSSRIKANAAVTANIMDGYAKADPEQFKIIVDNLRNAMINGVIDPVKYKEVAEKLNLKEGTKQFNGAIAALTLDSYYQGRTGDEYKEVNQPLFRLLDPINFYSLKDSKVYLTTDEDGYPKLIRTDEGWFAVGDDQWNKDNDQLMTKMREIFKDPETMSDFIRMYSPNISTATPAQIKKSTEPHPISSTIEAGVRTDTRYEDMLTSDKDWFTKENMEELIRQSASGVRALSSYLKEVLQTPPEELTNEQKEEVIKNVQSNVPLPLFLKMGSKLAKALGYNPEKESTAPVEQGTRKNGEIRIELPRDNSLQLDRIDRDVRFNQVPDTVLKR